MALNEAEMKAGDVVRLNSDCPSMAIKRISPVDAGLLAAYCV